MERFTTRDGRKAPGFRDGKGLENRKIILNVEEAKEAIRKEDGKTLTKLKRKDKKVARCGYKPSCRLEERCSDGAQYC